MVNCREILSLLEKYLLTATTGVISRPVAGKQFPINTVDKPVNSTVFLIFRLLIERERGYE
jgi:hypothetical protein